MNGEDGSLPPAGRFQRIEDTLIRIEDKLDTKAEAARLEALNDRVHSLEQSRFSTDEVTRIKRKDYRAQIALWGVALVAIGTIVNTTMLVVKLVSK